MTYCTCLGESEELFLGASDMNRKKKRIVEFEIIISKGFDIKCKGANSFFYLYLSVNTESLDFQNSRPFFSQLEKERESILITNQLKKERVK